MRVGPSYEPKLWTNDEDRKLIGLHREIGDQVRWYMKAGKALGRSGGAVQTRIKKLKSKGIL